MKKAYLILGSIAAIMGIIAYFVVFSPGTYELAATSTSPSSSGSLSFGGLAIDTGNTSSTDSTASSTQANIFSTSTGAADFATNYSYPYIANWGEDQNSFSITGAAIQGNQIAFALKIQVGNIGGCIPLNIRLVTDELGDLENPNQSGFSFPDSKSCMGSPNAAYTNQIITFTLASSTPIPYLFTTGGTSNQFFQISTTTGNGIEISLPATSG
jgi:hypothetical protein